MASARERGWKGRRWGIGLAPAKARRLRLVLGVVLALLLLGFAARELGWWRKAGEGDPPRLYGNVEIREVELGFRVGGRIAELLVDEGQTVAAGRVLARLDTRPLRDRLAQADARIAAASAVVARDVRGNRPQEIRQARAALSDAEAQLLEARRVHDRRRALLGRGFISRADYQASQSAVTAAAARVEAARAAFSLAREGPRAEDRAVSRAEQAATVAERQAIRTDLDDTVMRAPAPGQVLARVREAGAIVEPGQVVLTMALTQPVRVRAYVAETQLGRVRPGMRVTVHADGTDRTWPATVGFISPVAEFTPKTVQTEDQRTDLVYRMRLTVNDPRGELRQGQPVTVTLGAAAAGG